MVAFMQPVFNASRTRSSGGRLSVDLRERTLGVEQRPAELDERVARDDVVFAGAVGHRDEIRVAELLLQLEHDPLGRLLADAGDRLEAGRVAAHDRAAQVGDGRAGDDRERDLRPDAADGEELHEELALARGRRSRRAGARPRARGGTSRP